MIVIVMFLLYFREALSWCMKMPNWSLMLFKNPNKVEVFALLGVNEKDGVPAHSV